MRKIMAWLVISWGLLVVLFLGFLDINFRDKTQRSDYVTAFYVAGHLVADGEQQDLYPPKGARSFKNAPFVVQARRILPCMLPG